MLDTYVLGRPQTNYVTREVHEHRAPTDDSVSLLKEMQEKAEQSRIASFPLDDNGFSGKIEVFQTVQDCQIRAIAVFDLNGRRFRVEAASNGADFDSKEKLIVNLREEVVKKIGTEILLSMLPTVKF